VKGREELSSALRFEDSVIERLRGFLYRCTPDTQYTMIGLTTGMFDVFGHPVEHLIGNRVIKFADLIHRDDVNAVDTAVLAGLSDKKGWDIDYRLQRADGTYCWVHETGGGIWDATDRLAYAEGAVTDIDSLYLRMQKRTEELAAAASRSTDVLDHLKILKILALNAGIEAARLGQAGNGFAVLAGEMRRLADESELLTKAITTGYTTAARTGSPSTRIHS
jgi:hypothetical protein